VMIEVPSAALIADALAKTADFFAIGTNDLTQYTLAIDRTDDQVAYLYDPLHPAVLKLIALTVAAAARRGIPVSLCGEMAGDPRLAPLLLGLGVRELSMAPGSLLRVKARVRTVDMALARRKVTQALDAGDSAAVAKAIASLNSGPD
ncbi:MAG: putative PEP-binding protein, partial [Alphaproteobacteria bacterium]